MTSSALGIPITIAAAFCQNQKQLRGQFSTNGSAFTRYAFGSPVVVLYVVGLHVIAGLPGPKANVAFLAWVVLGSGSRSGGGSPSSSASHCCWSASACRSTCASRWRRARRRVGYWAEGKRDMPKSRIEAFSDGVFAIVITLLVLEIKVPSLTPPVSDAALIAALIDELPVLMSCVVSFFIIAIFWVSHHQFWHGLRHGDWALLWLNNLLLLFVVFIPIPTWMFGAYPALHTPAVAFGTVMSGAGLAFLAMRAYVGGRPELTDMTTAEQRRALRRSALGPLFNVAGAVVALWEPLWSFAFYVAVPILYFVKPPSRGAAR